MTAIVDRLEGIAYGNRGLPVEALDLIRAANEIKRLRGALIDISERSRCAVATEIACDALYKNGGETPELEP